MQALLEKKARLQAKLKALDALIEREQEESIYRRNVYPKRTYDENHSLYLRYPPDKDINEFLDELAGSEESCPHNDPYSVDSKEDQLRILRDMRDLKLPILGMFHHADDVRYLYEKYRAEVPLWFRYKYGQHFVK